MRDNKKLHISESERRDLQSLWDQAGERQYKCEKILLDNMNRELPERVTNNLGRLQFEEYLTDSKISRETNAGVFCDDLQKFERFKAAVELAHSSPYEEVRALSEELDSILFTLTSRMKKVLRDKEISLPFPDDLHDLKDKLNEATKKFLEVYEEEMESGEDTDGEKIKKSDVNIVRNYVVLRTLQEALTQFDTDLGKLSE
ncbi:unnamed protein product [Porites lobata]|uniref:Uncharacterized protein n=1 Tax=Porites lobata TaxID=104759 RepID=A0ABN8NI20_9CNID|nr:unnamed protein product [Porites lobata]